MAPSIFQRSSAPPVEKPTAVAGFSADRDLDEVWAEVIARCNKITSWNLNEKRDVSIDEVLANLNPPKEKSEVKDTAKAVFRDALICVQRFGQFAANTAGMVFGPSQQCFNAISFVITAVQDYDAVFGNITTLMERISVFMNKLKIHLDAKNADVKLDKRLRYTVYKVLDHFLTILGTTHKLTRGWKAKIKLAVEIGAFGKDEGIKDAMAKLETLIADVVSSEISTIVQELSKAAQNIRGVDRKLDFLVETQERVMSVMGHVETQQEQTTVTLIRMEAGQEKTNTTLDKQTTFLGQLERAEQQRKAEEEETKRLNDIREALNMPEGKKPWQEKQDELVTRCIPGTGEWLLKNSTFSRWTNAENGKNQPTETPTIKAWTNVLSLRAGEGYGKSHLCSLVVKHLLEKHRDDQRTGVAYYYFQRDELDRKRGSDLPGDSSGADGTTASNAVNKALKAIIYQLAAAKTSLGREYSKMIHKPCGSKAGDFGKSTDLWQSLITDCSKTLEGTFFIALDGIDESDGEPGRPLAQIIQEVISPFKSSQLKIRLFFTGRPEALDQLSLDELSIPAITIPPRGESYPNEDDLMLFAEERMRGMGVFADGNLAELKERTKSVLVKAVHGDYTSLSLKLSKVNQCRSERDVEKELKFAGESKEQGIKREIKALNLTLEEEEVKELNHLLSWEAVCAGDQSVDLYQQYLLLQPPETQSLVPLEKQIPERYSTVFDMGKDGIVRLKSDDIREYLHEEDMDVKDQANESTLPAGEVHLVRRMLQTHLSSVLGTDDTYARFGFEDFFQAKLKPPPPSIHIGSLQDCEIRSAQACLTVICDHFDEEKYSALHAYAWEWFVYHLMEIDISNGDTPTLQEAGRRLVRILTDVDVIDTWWNTGRLALLNVEWVYDTKTTDTVFNWLANPTVQSGLVNMPSERQWVVKITSEEGPSVRILMHVAKRIAGRWLLQTESMCLPPVNWLHGYLSHIRGEIPEVNNVSYENMCQIEEWAKKTLNNGDQEGKWHSYMARTCECVEYWEQAVARYRQAVELLPDDLSLQLKLAWALGKNSDSVLAVETWESVIINYTRRMTNDKGFETEFPETVLILEAMFDLIGDCHIPLKAFEKTKETYTKLLHGDWERHLRLALALERNEELKEAGDTLEDLISHNQERITTDPNYKTAYWETILHSIGSWNIQLKDFEKAETTYRKLFAEGMQRATFEEFAKKAVYFMTTALYKQGKHQEIIEVLEMLELRPDPDAGTWRGALLHQYAVDDDLHEHLSAAAIRLGKPSVLVEPYRMAIRFARGERAKIGILLQLQYFLGALLWAHDTPEERQLALGLWEDTLDQQLPEGIENDPGHVWNWIWWARAYSANKLAVTFLSMAKEAGLTKPLNAEAEKYATRLRRVTQGDQMIVRDRLKNTELSLARLYHLTGDDVKAREILFEYFRLAFQKTENEDISTRTDAWCRIAGSLQVLDDDENAIAAWMALSPIKPEMESQEQTGARDGDGGDDREEGERGDVGDEVEHDVEEGGGDDRNEKKTVIGTSTVDEEPQAVGGAEDAEETLTNGMGSTDGAKADEEKVAEDVEEDEDGDATSEATEEKLHGPGWSTCDGKCGKGWTYIGEVGDVYACKDCLDTQFESDCYAKLQAGTLEVKVCDPTHAFLLLLSIDREKWVKTNKDLMWVGGELVRKSEWVEKIKKEWRIDDASLKAREKLVSSVRRIQRVWRWSR